MNAHMIVKKEVQGFLNNTLHVENSKSEYKLFLQYMDCCPKEPLPSSALYAIHMDEAKRRSVQYCSKFMVNRIIITII